MEANYYIGVDISKGRLDWQANDFQNQHRGIGKAANTPNGISSLLRSWAQKGLPAEEMIVCFEHTGPYGLLLAAMLEQAGVRYVVVAAAQVQRSLGINRGKSDRLDAGRLAEYLWRFRDTLQPGKLPSETLLQLRSWLLWREKLVRMRTAVTNGLKANRLLSPLVNIEQLVQQMQEQQEQLTEQIKKADRKIQQTLRECTELYQLYKLLASIPGVGPVIAGWLLVYTEGCTRFDTARQFACFVGSAPFPHQSGEHRGPDRVSRWRCRRMKTLLLSGVHSAIQYDPELRAYYRRKCEEGKHRQSVKNAVVCKLIYRAFAVVKRGTPYVKMYQHQMVERP